MPRPKAQISVDLSRSLHMTRFVRNRSGKTIEEIAKEDKVTERTVQESISVVREWQEMRSIETMNFGVSGVVISTLDKASKALNAALDATEEHVEFDPNKGKNVTVEKPDHTIRLEAVEKVTELAKAIQPKSYSSHQTHVQVGVGIQQKAQVSGHYVGMEDRLRSIREELKNKPQLEEKTIQQAALAKTPDNLGDDDEEEEDGE